MTAATLPGFEYTAFLGGGGGGGKKRGKGGGGGEERQTSQPGKD